MTVKEVAHSMPLVNSNTRYKNGLNVMEEIQT